MSDTPSDKDFMAAHIESLKAELAAARAALAQVQLDKTEFDALKAKLARYEHAKMSEEPERLTYTRKLASGGVATEICVAAHKYDALRTFAAAQKVRADENERVIATIRAACEKDKNFALYLKQKFWHAHYVDILWRHEGRTTQVEGGWLSDIFYALIGKPRP